MAGELDTSLSDQGKIQQLIQSPDPIDPADWLTAAGVKAGRGKWADVEQPGFLDQLGSSFGIPTSNIQKNQKLIQRQKPWLTMLDEINRSKAARMSGPTQGDIAGGMETPLASRVGVPGIGSAETLQPSQTHPGAMTLSPRDVQEWQTPLNPMQAGSLTALQTQASQRPLNPTDAMVNEAGRKELIGIETKAESGQPLSPAERATRKVRGSAHPYSPSTLPGTPEHIEKLAGAGKAQDEADITHIKKVYTPTQLWQEEEKRRVEIEKELQAIEMKPGEEARKNRIANSLIETRKGTLKRLNEMTESLKAKNLAAADLAVVEKAVKMWKINEAMLASGDFSKAEQDEARAAIAQAAGILTDLNHKYQGTVIPDVGAPGRDFKGLGKGRMESPGQAQGDIQARYNALRKAGKTPEQAKAELGIK